MPNSRFNAPAFLLLMILGLTILAGCGPSIRLGDSFRVDALPADFPRLDATAALVMDTKLARLDKETAIGPEFNTTFNKALAEGLLQGTRVLIKNAYLTENLPKSGVDYLILPNNFYYERTGNAFVMSLEVTIRRVKDNKEWGLLVEGFGQPGPRPLGIFERQGREIHFIGSPLKNASLGQALNNSIFRLSEDYVKKFSRRIDSIQ